jgi:hypothetical protein
MTNFANGRCGQMNRRHMTAAPGYRNQRRKPLCSSRECNLRGKLQHYSAQCL